MPQNQSLLDSSKYVSTVTDRAYKEWQNAQDQMNWAKSEFAKNRGVTDKVVGQALDTSGRFQGAGGAGADFYTSDLIPGAKAQMQYARGYTTPERMMSNRAAAIAGSNLAFDKNKQNAEMQLASLGIDPSAGRYAGLDEALLTQRAAGAAGAGTTSDRQTEAIGQQYLNQAIQSGAGVTGLGGQLAGVGLQGGNAAVNAGLATTASGAATMGTPMDWTRLGDESIKQWLAGNVAETNANLRGREVSAEEQKAKQSQSSGLGALIGTGAGILGSIYGGPLGGLASSALVGLGGSSYGGGPFGSTGGTSIFGGLRAGGMVRKLEDEEPDDDPGLIREPFNPDDPRNYEDQDEREMTDQEMGEFEYGSPRHPRFPYMYEPRDEERYQRGGRVTPTPRIKGNLPTPRGTDQPGRVLPSRSVEWYERADPRSNLAVPSLVDEWAPPPEPPQFQRGGSVDYPPFDPQGSGYDYKQAREAGLGPQPVPHDTVPHWPSREPASGLLLKGRRHPTFDQAVDEDRRMGYGLEMQNGRYYSQPFAGYQDGGEVDEEEYPTSEVEAVPPEASPSGGEDVDDVNAMLSEGEFVIPKDVVSWLGEKFFQNLIEKTHREMEGPQEAEPQRPPLGQAQAMMPPGGAPTYRSQGAST